MQDAQRKARPLVSEELIETRDAVIRACDVATCDEEAAPYYEIAQKLARAWGSDTVAVMLFIGEDWLRGHRNWFPVFVEKTQFAPGYRRYIMMFEPKKKIMCDFSLDLCFGGTVMCDPDRQEALLQETLREPELKERLTAGMRNFGMKINVDLLISAFIEAFHEGQRHEPEKLFAQEA